MSSNVVEKMKSFLGFGDEYDDEFENEEFENEEKEKEEVSDEGIEPVIQNKKT